MMRVLVAEDDPRIADDIGRALKSAGYISQTVGDGESAWVAGGTESFVAIILDLGLPVLDGLTVLKRWREEGITTPVLILTARGSWTDRVDGIDAGADDYLPKPFHIEELLARLRAIIRRSANRATPLTNVGELVLDERQMRVTLKGVPLALSPTEYRLLAYLVLRKGRVVSHAELAEHISGNEDAYDSNAIEVLVGRVRRKVGGHFIETRRGFGYLVPEELT